MTTFIGRNRDARPHKACKVKEGTVEARWEEERPRRPIPVITSIYIFDGPGGRQGRWGCHAELVI